MKKLIIFALLCLAIPATAETWKDKEIREQRELELQLRQGRKQSSSDYGRSQSNASCFGDCGAEHGICVSNCSGLSNTGYSNAQGACIARCDVAQSRCTARCY